MIRSGKPIQAIQLGNRSEDYTDRVREQVRISDVPSAREGLHLKTTSVSGKFLSWPLSCSARRIIRAGRRKIAPRKA